jgi:hypothetical protein
MTLDYLSIRALLARAFLRGSRGSQGQARLPTTSRMNTLANPNVRRLVPCALGRHGVNANGVNGCARKGGG